MSTQQITPDEAWNAYSTFWSSFPFMLLPGATSDEIESFETSQNVTLQSRVKELIMKHSTIRIPTGFYGYFCAETTLDPIDKWVRFDKSILNTQMDDPDFWPQIFKDSGCPSTDMKDYTVIGSDPWGADYGKYVMLHQASNTAFSIDWNIPEVKSLGDIVNWLGQVRLGDFKDEKAYVDNWNNESDEPGGASIAKNNVFYLKIGYPEALKKWDTIQNDFINVFDQISNS